MGETEHHGVDHEHGAGGHGIRRDGAEAVIADGRGRIARGDCAEEAG